MKPHPHDWALFKAKLPDWQMAFMDRLNKEYIAMLTSDKAPDEKFWALEKRIQRDRKNPGVIISMTQSNMELNILSLITHAVISQADLADFSEDLRGRIAAILRE